MLDAKKITAIKKAIVYNPVNGTFRRVGWRSDVYLKPNNGGAPRIMVHGKEYSARTLAYLLMTGEYLDKHQLRSRDGDPFNLRWENIHRNNQGTKFCPRCHEEKPYAEFPKNKNRPNGVASSCKKCRAAWHAKSNRKQNMRKFGLTVEEYERLLIKQGGACAICKQPEAGKRLAVDHCHTSGRVRGLLCMRCNTSIGKLYTVDLLEAAKQYIIP